MKFPTLLINFKTYEEASGKNAIELVKICKELKSNISCAVSNCDLNACAKLKIPILSQHLDSETAGGHTGKIHVKMLKENGAEGVLINHSEDRISFLEIKKLIEICKQNKLVSVVCSKTVPESKSIAQLNPDCIAIEPPELIGGDISVTSANPDIISNTVKAVKNVSPKIKVLCGAGVKNGKDVKIALKLGADGVLVASGVTKAKNKKKAVEDLLKGLK
ncbi:MAG: triose-phosphate isomerase [Candidatus Woesearchaeota archaeon]